MINFNSVSLKPALSELNFKFDGGVMCVVTDREKSEDAFFSLITKELKPDVGKIESDLQHISLCTNGLPCEVKVKEYLGFVQKCKKCSILPEISEKLTEYLLDSYIGSLTELEKIMVSAASALIGEPSLILLRSPAKSLEPRDIKKLGNLIDELSEYADIIYSCNIPSLFGEHSDKLLIISESKLLGYADTEEMFALSRKEGGLLAKIKGDIDAAAGFLMPEVFTLSPSEKAGIFTVRCADSEQSRKDIRAVVRKLGMAILSMKADNDALKDIFSALSRKEEELELNNEDELEDDDDVLEEIASEHDSQASVPSQKPKLSVSFAHIDEENEE